MKKLLLMAAAVLGMGMANAQTLYLTGDDDGWKPGSPIELTAEGGYYTYVTTKNFKISTSKGTWDAFNAGCKCVQGGNWNISGNEATGTLVSGDANINSPAVGKEITYKINTELTSITATWEGQVEMPDFYLIGPAVGGWNLGMENMKMTRSGNAYTLTVSSLNGEWKINNGSWALDYGQGQNGMPEANVLYNVAKGGGNLSTTFTEEVKVTFTYEPNGQSTLLLTTNGGGGGGGGGDTTDYSTWYVNVFGPFNDWTDNGVHPVDGISKTENLAIGQGEFKIKIWDGTADSYYSTGGAVATGEWVKIAGDNSTNMTVAGAADDSVYTVEFNCATNSIRITPEGETPIPPTQDYTNWYVNIGGDFNNWLWEGFQCNAEGVADLGSQKIGTSDFEFKIWNGTADSYYGDQSNPIVPNTWQQLYVGGGHMTVSGATADQTFNVKYNAATNQIFLSPGTGVETFEAEEGVAEYFNLQGARVANPENGIFVRVLNGKATKVVK